MNNVKKNKQKHGVNTYIKQDLKGKILHCEDAQNKNSGQSTKHKYHY